MPLRTDLDHRHYTFQRERGGDPEEGERDATGLSTYGPRLGTMSDDVSAATDRPAGNSPQTLEGIYKEFWSPLVHALMNRKRLSGGTLEGRLREGPPLGPAEILDTMLKIARALGAAADRGDWSGLLAFPPAVALPLGLRLVLANRLDLLERERHAAKLYRDKEVSRLLREAPETRAGRAAAREILEGFRKDLPPGERFELVSPVVYLAWKKRVSASRDGKILYDRESRSYLLTSSAPAERERVSIIFPGFAGTRDGYQVRARFGKDRAAATFGIVINPRRWIDLGIGKAALRGLDKPGTRARTIKEVLFPKETSRLVAEIVPFRDLLLVWAGGRLLFVLSGPDAGHAGEIHLAAGGGTVFIESIRIKTRSP